MDRTSRSITATEWQKGEVNRHRGLKSGTPARVPLFFRDLARYMPVAKKSAATLPRHLDRKDCEHQRPINRAMRQMKANIAILTAVMSLAGNSANAATTFSDGSIKSIEAEVMPSTVLFLSSANDTNCPQNPMYAGTPWLWFSSQNTETNKAVYAAILSAYTSGKNLHLTWETTTCQVTSVRAI
jgi:hypothetical protein